MRTSYHVHSNLSDGQSSIFELAKEAQRQRLDELGVSNHYVMLPGGATVEWSMPLDALDIYFQEVEDARAKVGERLTIRSGIEADYIPETVKDLADTFNTYPFDYVIGSVHFVGDFTVDEAKRHWDELTEDERNGIIVEYWNRVTRMAQTRLFDVAGHLDLYKKFGYLPTTDISDHVLSALDAIADAGMVVEFNTSGWYKPDIREAYPSATILQGCQRRGIPILLTADAHKPEDLTRGYDRGETLLSSLGCKRVKLFHNKRFELL